jgi:hypothetical protein
VALRGYLANHGKPMAFYSDKAGIFRVNAARPRGGDGITQFGRALYELSITGLCANTPQAKGRVERAHQPLQDRLVKELRLNSIGSIEAANAFVPAFIEDYNSRFAKPARDVRNAHRTVRGDEDLELILTWREQRRVSENLTLQFDKRLYMLADSPLARRLIGKYADVYQYPDGRIEVRSAGTTLPYVIYDRLPTIEQGAVVDSKRLGAALRVAQFVQQQRDDTRTVKAPSQRHLTGVAGPRSLDHSKVRPKEIQPKHLEQAIQQLTTERTAG